MGGAHRATAIGFVSAFSRLPVHPANAKANNRAMILIRAIPHSVRFPKRRDAANGMLSSELAAGNMIRAKTGKARDHGHPDEDGEEVAQPRGKLGDAAGQCRVSNAVPLSTNPSAQSNFIT
jgi:hypothetical protein